MRVFVKDFKINGGVERSKEIAFVWLASAHETGLTGQPITHHHTTLKDVKRGQRTVLSDGYTLFDGNQGDFLVGSLQVWEVDEGARAIGRRITRVASSVGQDNLLVSAFVRGNPTIAPVVNGLRALALQVGNLLSSNQNDLLAEFPVCFKAHELSLLEPREIPYARDRVEVTTVLDPGKPEAQKKAADKPKTAGKPKAGKAKPKADDQKRG